MLAHLGAFLAHLGGYVGRSWGYVGPSWGILGPSWGLCCPMLRLCGLCWPSWATKAENWKKWEEHKTPSNAGVFGDTGSMGMYRVSRRQGRRPLFSTERRELPYGNATARGPLAGFKRLRATAGQGPTMLAHFVAMLAYVDVCWPILRAMWAHLVAMLAYVCLMLAHVEPKDQQNGNSQKDTVKFKTQDILMVGGLSWGYVGPSWGRVGLLESNVGPSSGHVGPSWGYVGPSWGLCWPILRLCWPILRPKLAHVDPSWARCASFVRKMLNVTGPQNTVNYRGFCRHAHPTRGRRLGRRPLSPTERRETPTAMPRPGGPWPPPAADPWVTRVKLFMWVTMVEYHFSIAGVFLSEMSTKHSKAIGPVPKAITSDDARHSIQLGVNQASIYCYAHSKNRQNRGLGHAHGAGSWCCGPMLRFWRKDVGAFYWPII